MDEYLAEIIDEANEGIYVTDKDRRFLLWNKAAQRIAGFSKDEMLGHYCHENILSHQDHSGRQLCFTACPLQASIADGIPRGPEVVFMRHKSGRRIPVEVKTAAIRDSNGTVVGGVEIFQDVAERIERERLLLERQEKLETVLDGIGDGILFLDTAGSISVVNRVCASLFGLDSAAAGGSIFSLPGEAPLQKAFAAVEEAYERTMSMAVERADRRCPDGKGRFRCWTAAIDRSDFAPISTCYTCGTYRGTRAFLEKPHDVPFSERTVTAVSSFIELPDVNELWEVVVFHDVTAEKLDAALKVAGAAAHELRQPLQTVLITAGLLEQELKKDRKLGRHLRALLKSCDRMDRIIGQMNGITAYRTKEYIGGTHILDIEHSSRKH